MTVEYAEYDTARRTALVRSVVLLGCPERDAEDVVQAALLRCFRHWRRVQRADRPDAYVYRVLVNTLRDDRARRCHGETPTAEVPDVAVPADHATGLAVRQVSTAQPRPTWPGSWSAIPGASRRPTCCASRIWRSSSRQGITGPIGVFFAELPAGTTAGEVEAIAYDADGQRLGTDDFANFRDQPPLAMIGGRPQS